MWLSKGNCLEGSCINLEIKEKWYRLNCEIYIIKYKYKLMCKFWRLKFGIYIFSVYFID